MAPTMQFWSYEVIGVWRPVYHCRTPPVVQARLCSVT